MEPKVLILFGAGASHGCDGVYPPPPLGRDLFDILSKQFPNTWGKIPAKQHQLFRENFELGMEASYGVLHEMADLLKDMAIYFSRFRINDPPSNLYYKLIGKFRDEILTEKILFSTINYECLIEYALSYFNPTITCCGKNEGIKLLKLHGSCNFIPLNVIGTGNADIMTATIKVDVKVIEPMNVEKELANIPFPPAMCLYAKGKRKFLAPNFLNEIQKEFYQVLSSAELIITIGVNPNPDDHHIWDYLKDASGKLILIGNKENCTNWLEVNRSKNNSLWLADKFDTKFEELCDIISNQLH